MTQQVSTENIYKKMKSVLKGAKDGEVVTRFAPEPSGYLHLGHVKSVMLSYHYAKIYNGKMILRFDDTNPSKEKVEFVDNIIGDLRLLGVQQDKITHSSDYFELLKEFLVNMIKDGKAYCDNTDVETMRKNRGEGIESPQRSYTPEENLAIFEKLYKGEADDYCVRAKIDMQCKNKCMRDPTLWRVNKIPHHRTGTKYCSYPTYDFCCPIIDSHEGITHALRDNLYTDRNDQYNWIQKALGIRPVVIYDFSRLNLVYTILSKRNLTWLVENDYVDGWNDPRFPTVQGILRRGVTVQCLVEFMLENGPSKNTNLMEWDKIWASNKKIIDVNSGRYYAISKDKISTLKITNFQGEGSQMTTVNIHDKNPALGQKVLYKSNTLYLEFEDANSLVEGEKITLMKWGNFMVNKITKTEQNIQLEGEYMEGDTDFKSTKKLCWLDANSPLTEVALVEFDNILNVKKYDSSDPKIKFEEIVNKDTKFETLAMAEPHVKTLNTGIPIQFERRGFFYVDQIATKEGSIPQMIFIPDGKTKNMSTLVGKVDVAKVAGKEVL